MKSIIFDSGPIISLATNNLLWILEILKKEFNGKFLITKSVKRELVDHPLTTKKFKFEAIQVQKLIDNKILEIIDSDQIRADTKYWLQKSNEIFNIKDNYLNLIHHAEMSALISALDVDSSAVVIDEKTTRFLVENPKRIIKLLKKNFHQPIKINEKNLKETKQKFGKLKILRSVELVTMAFELGILDKYLIEIEKPRKTLLEGLLWGLKLNGCAVSNDEIERIIRMEI